MVIFEDAGHVPMEERPGETLDAMMPFLQEFRKQP
jgi:pimeloyl-ACP methyl ester carboxylesterase